MRHPPLIWTMKSLLIEGAKPREAKAAWSPVAMLAGSRASGISFAEPGGSPPVSPAIF